MDCLVKRSAHASLLMIAIALAGCFEGGNGRSLDDEMLDLGGFGGASGQGGGSFWSDYEAEHEDAGVPATPDLPEPFSHEFDALITQPVRWADLDVSVIAARQVRGLDGESTTDTGGLLGETFIDRLSPGKIYVELELELANRGAEEHVYQHRDTWDLILADGKRLQPADGITVNILPDDVATALLHYEVTEEILLDGAMLELNGEDRTTLEAERVPLDVPYAAEFPRRIASMVGQVVHYDDTFDAGDVTIDEAVYDINRARAGRAERGQRIVWLDIAFTAMDLAAYTTGDLRIVVNGRAQEPTEAGHGVVDENTTSVFHAQFSIDSTAESFEIMVPDGTPQGIRFPVNVSDTVLATDIP